MPNSNIPQMPFEILNSNIEQIKYRYDPEHDAGNVTWVDARLLETIEILTAHIAAQHAAITSLINHINGMEQDITRIQQEIKVIR